MTRRLLVAIVVALGALAVPALARADGTISGTVTDTAQEPLAGVCVFAGPSPRVTTAADGSYAIQVPAGSYAVEFSSCGPSQNLVTQWWPNQSSPSSATPVNVADGQTIGPIDALMLPGGQISVQAVDADTGGPIAGLSVSVWTPGITEADPLLPPAGTEPAAETSVSGAAVFSDLPTGAYLIEADGAAAPGYASSWYPNAPDPAHGQLVELHAGQTVGIRLPFFHGGTVNGTVTARGGAVGRSTVQATIAEPDGSTYDGGGAVVLPNGQYTTDPLAPGQWTLTAAAGHRWVPRSTDVVIAENAAQVLDFRLPRGPAVDGRIPVHLRRLKLVRHGRRITVIGRISERAQVRGKVTISYGHLFPGRHTLRLARFAALGGRFRITIRVPRRRSLINPRLFVDIDESAAFGPARFERRLPHAHRRRRHRR